MEDQLLFETTNIQLAAALLVYIPKSNLHKVASTPSVDGKKLITISYPDTEEKQLRKVVDQFLNRKLSVPLYAFNRNLNLLRDKIH